MGTQVNAVELIKDQLGIVEALSIYAGADFTRTNLNREKTSIKCPFHSDRSPSMTLYLKDNRFRCWSGCNEGKPGDVIDVVRLAYNLSTGDAIKQLRNDLNIKTGVTDRKTITRIQEKRRELEKIKFNQQEFWRALDFLQWLSREIPKLSKSIESDCELEAWAPLIRVHSQIEYNIDCLLGLEDCPEWKKNEVIQWTKGLMEGVNKLVRDIRIGGRAAKGA